ncbi:MAG: DUF1559 domain-containing protein [Isosphaeraceae bacterium]|nr:DUF1559 domain-containing protein [Isosphaeraceae bacterium]
MAIIVSCECGKQFQTGDENAGRRARCPDCGRDLIVPPAGQVPDKPYPMTDGVDFPPAGEDRTSGKAIAGLVLGLSSFICCAFTGIPAIILGILGLSDIKASQGRVKGHGMAVAGIVLGTIGCTLVVAAVLLALLLPAVQAAREAARRSQCVNNLKQIGLALHNYESANSSFPPAAITDKDGKPLLSWRVAILPYIERGDLYNQFHLDEPWDSPHNSALMAQMPVVYRCPSDPVSSPGTTTYQVFVGPGTLFEEDEATKLATVTDGTSNTLAVVETTSAVPWTKPEDQPYGKTLPLPAMGSHHPGGFNALFADGSVRFLKTSISEQILRGLITRNGGEVLSSDAY